MGKIIIKYNDDMAPENVLMYVRAVVEQGRISGDGKSYCYATIFNDGTVAMSDVTKSGTDTFRIDKE